MLSTSFPGFFQIPFANAAGAGYIRSIPQASQVGITAGAASLTDGFPPLNFVDPATAGGIPPSGADMNGILYQISANIRWQQAGNFPVYNAAFSTGIGGYPKGAVLMNITATGMWSNTVESNTSNPDAGGAGWVAVGASSVPWTGVTGKPTTISGYGITDVNTYAPTLTGTGASGTWPISVTGAASSNVLKAGDTMTGALITTANEGMRLTNSTGLITGYNTANTAITGYLQFNAGGYVQLTAPLAATNGIYLNTNGGSIALSQTGAVTATGTVTAAGFTGPLTTAAQPAILSVGTSLATTGTGTVNITADGRLYGTALHNNANPVTGTVNQYIASGTYTPTFTTIANASAASMTGTYFTWMRVGNVVHVAGTVSITVVAVGNANIELTLPIASNFALNNDLSGSVSNSGANNTGAIGGDATTHKAAIGINATLTGAINVIVMFQYAVI